LSFFLYFIGTTTLLQNLIEIWLSIKF
jgi:hypothetical protein